MIEISGPAVPDTDELLTPDARREAFLHGPARGGRGGGSRARARDPRGHPRPAPTRIPPGARPVIRRDRLLLVAILLGWLLVGCESPQVSDRPSATASPPTLRAPSDSTYTFDGREWVVRAILDPHGLPTKVTFVLGVPAASSGRTVSVGADLDTAGVVEARVSAGDVVGDLCGRFVAENAAGSATFNVGCLTGPDRPSRPPGG